MTANATPSPHSTHSTHSMLLETFLPQLSQAVVHSNLPILDLACGSGRNGLCLFKQDLPVVFADRNQNSLNTLNHQLKAPSRTWSVDFEVPDSEPLSGQSFSAIMVFRYLHRPLFDAIKQAIAPGGMIIYETFTVAQAELGRPKNPDFLLRPGELAQLFDGWQVLHQFEGISNGSAIAQLVAVKPDVT